MYTIKNFIRTINHNRDANVRFHAIFSVFLKFFSLIVNFSLVPLTINFFGLANYGLYTALVVISGWVVFLDVGMSQSFRNSVSTYYASNDTKTTKTFISTTYAIFGIIGLSCFLIFIFVSPFINFSNLLGQVPDTNFNITQVFTIVVIFTLFNFMNRLITIILMATQNASVPVFLSLITNIIILFLLYFLDDLIEVETVIEKVNHASLIFTQKIVNIDKSTVLFNAIVKVVSVLNNNLKPCALPQEILEKLNGRK